MNDKRKKRHTLFATAISIVLICSVGFIGWRLYKSDQNQSRAQQVQTIPDKKATPLPPQETTTHYVLIKEWNVRFKPLPELGHVLYMKLNHINGDVITFTTNELAAKEPGCSQNGTDRIVLGLLRRSKEADPAAGNIVATSNGYVYQYRVSGAACSTGDPLLESRLTILLSQSLTSLEAVKE